MQLTRLHLKNFRCFNEITLAFESPITLLSGCNGSGKTSLIEAMHYLCYLRSFRTHTPRELLAFEQETFFLRATVRGDFESLYAGINELQVGFSGKKRLVKLNQKAVSSYKELIDCYRIITLTEDDLALIKDGPEMRRSFLDAALLLHNPTYATTLRHARHIVDNRNSLLYHGNYSAASYHLWTQQLWDISRTMQEARIEALRGLEEETNALAARYVHTDTHIALRYVPKKMGDYDTFDLFMAEQGAHLEREESRIRRSLFGAHLDDFSIILQGNASKSFASRGQQKLLILLLKMAQMQELIKKRGPAILLLDDFMTDFDEKKASSLLQALASLNCQRIFTSPLHKGTFHDMLLSMGASAITLPTDTAIESHIPPKSLHIET